MLPLPVVAPERASPPDPSLKLACPPLTLSNTGVATDTFAKETKGLDAILEKLHSSFANRVRTVVVVTVEKVTPLTSPAYDDGRTEAELRRAWTERFRTLQPGGKFEE